MKTKVFNCIVVEDEPPAIDILKTYIALRDELLLVGVASSVEQATFLLSQNKVDLVFLDINLPGTNGIQFLRQLKNKPAVIFTTALREYALEGFELDAVDYLLKPFSLDRFNRAVLKLSGKTNDLTENRLTADDQLQPFIYLKSGKENHKVFINDILYIESSKDYCKVVFNTRFIIVRNTIQNMESLLPVDKFIRIHRSYIINRDMVTRYDNRYITISNKQKLAIGQKYKQLFLGKMRRI